MRVIVLGAAGFLGRAVLRSLEGRHEVTAFDHGPAAWSTWSGIDGEWTGGPVIHGDISDFDAVHRAIEGHDAVIHLAAMLPPPPPDRRPIPTVYADNDDRPFLINLKGLWNVLEISRRVGVQRVVHLGSCHTSHPSGRFLDSDVRRSDGHLYAIHKRMQEEMCRQFFEAHALPLLVLRVSYVVDAVRGIGRYMEPLTPSAPLEVREWVDRADVAEACRLAIENRDVAFDILHVAENPEAEKTCNSGRTKRVLGLAYRGNVMRYAVAQGGG